MSQISEAIVEHFELCRSELPKKFVPWSWVVGLSILGLTGNIGSSIIQSEKFNNQGMSIQALQIENIQNREDIKNLKELKRDVAEMLDILRAQQVGKKR